MKKLLLLALLPLSAPAVSAQAETQSDVLAAQLLPGWQMPSGNYMTGLDLTLAPKWKTYWRAPGETGIPPEFDWSGSQNVAAVKLHWPSPQVFTLNGMTSIGYHDALLLPVEVIPADPAKPVSLSLQMQLGICKDICMPASLTLNQSLSQSLGGLPDARITGALAQGPDTAPKSTIACQIAPIEDGLRVTAAITLPAVGSPETVVFETADKTIWVAEATSDRQGRTLTSTTDFVPTSGAPFALNRSAITVTVIGQSRSVEIAGCPAP